MELRPFAPSDHRVTATARRAGQRLVLSYRVADPAALRLTDGVAARTDGLWRHTCFEAFVAGAGAAYREYNFAPSGGWAAYAFDAHRSGGRDADAAPAIAWDGATLDAAVEVPVAGDWRLNLSAVLEGRDGRVSHWALAHPRGAPDFHDPACFALTLPAA